MVNGTHRFLGTWVLSNTRKGDYFKFQGLDLSSHLAVLKHNNIYSFIGIVFYEYLIYTRHSSLRWKENRGVQRYRLLRGLSDIRHHNYLSHKRI